MRRLLVALAFLALALPAAAVDVEKLVMPGPVIAGHADVEGECTTCHAPFDREAEDGLCIECHEGVGADLSAGVGFHGRAPGIGTTPCRSCHTDHEGRDADIDIDVARAVHVETIVGSFDGSHTGDRYVSQYVNDNVTIISGRAIDETTRENISSILSSAGHTGDVVFVDREIHDGDADSTHSVHESRRIKIISREVNATN